MLHIGEELDSREVVILTDGLERLDGEMIYRIITTSLDQHNGSVIFQMVQEEEEYTLYTKYAYFTRDNFLEDLILDKGRVLGVSENGSDLYLSSLGELGNNKIGVISNYHDGKEFEFRTLASSNFDEIFHQSFSLQLEDMNMMDDFVAELRTVGIIIQETGGKSSLELKQYNVFSLFVVVAFILLILLIFYKLINSYKKISIEKMLGYNTLTIWKKRMIPIMICELIAIFVVSGIVYLFKQGTSSVLLMEFIFHCFYVYFIMMIVSVVVLSLPFIYIKKIKIINMLKNRRPTKEIIILNFCVKTGLVILFISLLVSQFSNLQLIKAKYHSAFHNWEKTMDYITIPSFGSPGYDLFSEDARAKSKELYLVLNKKGGIYADFNNYLTPNYEMNKANLKQPYKYESIRINPNYLEELAILDENGDRIKINETETEIIYLVPEKYRDLEAEVYAYYNWLSNPSLQDTHRSNSEENHKEDNAEEDVLRELKDIHIIWTKSKQKFFSYQLDINPTNGNQVMDPVVRVLTEYNGSIDEYNFVAGYMGEPFKIKVENIKDHNQEIVSLLEQHYDLNKFSYRTNEIYKSINTQVRKAKDQIEWVSLMFVIMLVMVGVIIFHNISIYYEQNKLKLALQKFHGYKMRDKFMDYFVLLCSSWIIVFPISILMRRDIVMIFFVLFLLLFEIVVSMLLFLIVEKRKVLSITKGGQ